MFLVLNVDLVWGSSDLDHFRILFYRGLAVICTKNFNRTGLNLSYTAGSSPCLIRHPFSWDFFRTPDPESTPIKQVRAYAPGLEYNCKYFFQSTLIFGLSVQNLL